MSPLKPLMRFTPIRDAFVYRDDFQRDLAFHRPLIGAVNLARAAARDSLPYDEVPQLATTL